MSGIVLTALLVPLTAILGILALIAFSMYLRHRERRPSWTLPGDAQLPQHIPSRPRANRSDGPRSSVESSLSWIGVGFALIAGLATLGVGPWLIPGLLVLFVGLVRFGLVTWGLEPMGRLSAPPQILLSRGLYTGAIGLALLLGLWTLGSGPWLLGGLIPLGIGLGRIAAARLAATTFMDQENPDTGRPWDVDDGSDSDP